MKTKQDSFQKVTEKMQTKEEEEVVKEEEEEEEGEGEEKEEEQKKKKKKNKAGYTAISCARVGRGGNATVRH